MVCQQQVIRVYSLPDGTFSSDEDEEEEEDEEDEEDEGEKRQSRVFPHKWFEDFQVPL